MLYLLISIIGIFLTIFFVIGTHEYAHFQVARLLGVKILRFSIGFGKTLFHWRDKKGTEYVIALIPLGGYVKMLDEQEGEVHPRDLKHAFNRQPFYKKFLIVLAGPVMNILCAFILYWLIFVIGFTTVKPIIGDITPRSIAAEGGLKANQEIVRVDNSNTTSWTKIMLLLITHAGNQDHLKIEVKEPDQNTTSSHILDLSNWHMQALSPNPLSELGITPYEPKIPLIIGTIAADSPASISALKVGDTILAINKKPIKNWNTILTYIVKHPQQTFIFTIERAGKVSELPVHIGKQGGWLSEKTGYLGISPQFTWPEALLQQIKYSPVQALGRAWEEISDFTYFNLLLFGKILTGKLSLQSLGGPITIFESAGTALNSGFLSFIGFLAFLSISIGIINLLPIPGLDGGHLLLQTIELIIRRSIPEKFLLNIYRVGFLLIFFILIQAIMNDILRLYWR